MAFDVKAQAESVIKKITSDKTFRENFLKDPVKAVESVTGVDLPDDQINKVIAEVKNKVDLNSLGNLGGIASSILGGDGKADLSALGSLFGKK